MSHLNLSSQLLSDQSKQRYVAHNLSFHPGERSFTITPSGNVPAEMLNPATVVVQQRRIISTDVNYQEGPTIWVLPSAFTPESFDAALPDSARVNDVPALLDARLRVHK